MSNDKVGATFHESDAAAKEIAKTIMREQNVDNLEGFGQITMGRIERMLMSAYNTGHLVGYSEGFRDGQQ